MTVTSQETGLIGGRPVVPSRGALRPLGLREVRISNGFWGRRQQVNGAATLDHGRFWLDRLGWTDNFRPGATDGAAESASRRGREFTDSEVYKLMEAMSWEVGRAAHPVRDDRLDLDLVGLTGMLAAAQAPDGYLNTAFGRPGQRPRYSDLAFGHELYCTGHLLQAAVARTRTSGPDGLLSVARRAADHVCEAFGPTGIDGVCGHPEIEPALVELARVTGEQRYLDQAALFVARRGHRTLPRHHLGWSYFSDDEPVRRATVLRGHAVRALYLACGAVDVAVETGDDELLGTVAGQFANTLARRSYLTGGMGARHADEAFGDDFVLPADRAYSETCAGVAAVMLAWRLLLATGEMRYGDVIERILYNVVATAIGDDGRSFFYANTLHQRRPTEQIPTDREQLGFGGGPRAPWFEVSCCLPNIARTLASLSGYLATADDRGLQIHQYADSEIRTRLPDGRRVGVRITTDYPDRGTVILRVTDSDGPWRLSLRVPEWAAGAVVVDGQERRPVAPGVAVLEREFAVGDVLRLDLPVRPRYTLPDPRIDAVRGCVAVERGPVVLCAESIDQCEPDLDRLVVDPTSPPEDIPSTNNDIIVAVRGGYRAAPSGDWPYRTEAGTPPPEDPGLAGSGDPALIRMVPYHRWARRGPSTMRVWLPRV
nr:glycoside hydrolase family 127 protein [Micromonospora sp. DSM 115978]